MVTNQYMPDFDYTNTQFTFKTVYNVSKYTYCCCPCGFEHEYLDYISEGGQINEEIYEKTVQSIMDGKCPHVDEVNEEHIKETGIFGINIAVALRTDSVLSKDDVFIPTRYTSLFCLDSLTLAVVKNVNVLPLQVIRHFANITKCTVPYMVRSEQNHNEIHMENINILELSIRNKNEFLLETLPIYTGIPPSALRPAFSCRSDSILNLLLKNVSLTNHRTEWVSVECCRLSIIYDQPEILRKHLLRFTSTFHVIRRDLESKLCNYCTIFKRSRCRDVLLEFLKYKHEEGTVSEQVALKIKLLMEFYDDDNIREEIIASLERILDTTEDNELQKKEFLQIYSKLKFFCQNDGKALKTALNVGAKLYRISHNDILHLETLLSHRYLLCLAFRKMAEIFLFENPDLEANKSVLKKAVEVDQVMSGMTGATLQTSGEKVSLQMDAKLHAVFKHDDTQDFALNFFSPLLIECGFLYPADVYNEVVNHCRKKALHPAVEQYFCEAIYTPRLLTLRCRDVLRKHFKGRQIHKFVETRGIPQKTKDFILLRPLLKFVPENILH